MSQIRIPRGVRNNNPGNIDYLPANKWIGLASPPIESRSDGARFAVFTDAKWGIRAIMRILITYQVKYELHTLRQIIGRWAPNSENDTDAYVSFVANRCKMSPDDEIDLRQASVAIPVVKAIIYMENSGYQYPDHVLNQAAIAAGLQMPSKSMAKSKTVIGTAMTATGAAIEPLAHLGNDLTSTGQQLQFLMDISPYIQTISVILILAGLGLSFYGRWHVHKRTGV